ncbi:MAG: cation:proton antiporter [Candidatus Limimorpha sp.]
MDSTALSLVVLGTLVFAAHVFSELFSRKRVPDLLLLLIIGIIIGPVFKIVTPDDLGGFGQVFSTLTLVIILFEGGSELSLSNIKTSFKDMMSLTLVSYFLIMIVFGILGHFVLHFPWATSFFMSAVLGGAAEAIVIPLTKHLKISENSKATLVLETSFSTVVCFIISFALFNAVKSQQFEIGRTIGNIISSFVLAGIIGFAGAVFWAIVLQKIRTVKNSTFTTPAFVFIIYGINSILGFSGEIAALTFGITLTNIDAVYNSIFKKLFKNKPNSLNYNERMLFSEMAFLLRTFVFVYIGISIQLNDWKSILIGLAITILLLILRILSVRWTIVKNNSGYTEIEAMYMSCMMSKGLVAAILASLLKQAGLPFADEIQNIVYSVILFSIVLTCAMIPLLEKSKFIQKILLFMLYFPKKKEAPTTNMIDNQEDTTK